MCLVDAAAGTPTVSPSEDTRKLSLAVIIEWPLSGCKHIKRLHRRNISIDPVGPFWNVKTTPRMTVKHLIRISMPSHPSGCDLIVGETVAKKNWSCKMLIDAGIEPAISWFVVKRLAIGPADLSDENISRQQNHIALPTTSDAPTRCLFTFRREPQLGNWDYRERKSSSLDEPHCTQALADSLVHFHVTGQQTVMD
jgi:hypothetical protein